MLARIYLAADRARRRIGIAIDGTWTGIWLGLLRPADLHVVDEMFYASRSSYHTDEHNRRGLFDWEVDAINKHFPPRGLLRLIGAGGGREVLALTERGYAVEAYECNPSLVRSANELLANMSPRPEVKFLARDCAPGGATKADGIIVGWSAYMLISSRARRIALLKGLRTGASNGTPLLISFFTRSGSERRLQFVASVAATVRRLRGGEPPGLGDDLVPLFVHRFTREEVEAELAAAKFQLIEFREEGWGPYDSGFAVALARDE
ncbi:MAG: SAM-dependent methyltransferase [bacterium]